VFGNITRFVVWSAVCVSLLGCGKGGGLVPVTGKVTYKDQPVAGATVTFVPEGGTPAIGVTDANGVYTLNTQGLPGTVKGNHKVGITKVASAAEALSPTPGDMKKMQTGPKTPDPKSEIPAKYAAPQASGLTVVVSGDKAKDVFDLQLKD
jgi:hypothetical protein